MTKEEIKKPNSDLGETSNKDEESINAENEESKFVDLDWIFDKGWLRTKK